MQLYCEAVPGPKMYNNVSAGHPMPPQAALPAIGHQSRAYSFPPQVLKEIGFKLVIYPDVLLGTSLRAMNEATQIAQSNTTPDNPVVSGSGALGGKGSKWASSSRPDGII